LSLPIQKLPFSKKNESWKKDTIDYYERMSYSSATSIRNTNNTKKINYDLFNGKFNIKDLEYVCNPLGLSDHEFPATLQHYDVSSPPLNLLLGEETKRNDNFIIFSESINDINRKQSELKSRIVEALKLKLQSEIEPDPQTGQIPTPEEIIKYEKHNVTDLIESQANKILKYIKKHLNTKEVFNRGFKDALLSGEEIYWTGVSNKEVSLRKCNPLNITIILDGDTDYVDDAIAVIEVRMLTVSTILDEFGEDIEPTQVTELESISKRYSSRFNNTNTQGFVLDTVNNVIDTGIGSMSTVNATSGAFNSDLIRVCRVEWKSLKKLYYLTYLDENDLPIEKIVDESFDIKIFKDAFPTAKVEEFWINEAWEGVKIGNDIYVNVQPKVNQRRRLDNPYYCKLGYVGLIYNATNSVSVSLMDRIKPYQYLYNIISYRLELAFAQDQGKKFVMDLAQIPRSEGIDVDKWMYYLKAMGIAFINSHEEGRKGSMTGKTSQFNQFTAIDLSMSNTIQQYINTLDYIKQQMAFISGVSPQRLGAIDNKELVGNVERSVQQSALITEYLFNSHDEVKKRVYTALIECAKIAFREGKKVQYALDDMGIEILDIPEYQLENSEFNVYVSNNAKDLAVVETLKQLSQAALNSDKADLSTIIDTVINDNPSDIKRILQRGEAAKYERDRAMQEQTLASQEKQIQMQLAEKEKDRELKQYEVDSNNQTKIMVAEINAMRSMTGPTDMDNDGIPDPIEIAKLSFGVFFLYLKDYRLLQCLL